MTSQIYNSKFTRQDKTDRRSKGYSPKFKTLTLPTLPTYRGQKPTGEGYR